MPSTFFGLEIARRGLLAMDPAAHNLANANTEGYTRQQAVHVAENPYTIPVRDQKVVPGQIGTGVTVAEIRRVRDTILDAHVRRALGDAGYWEERSDALARVEALFPEPGDYGIQQAIAKFFNYWQDLNNSPQDLGLKAAVREAGEELASMIRVTYAQLEENYNGLKGTLQDKVDEINNLAEEIRGINEAIARLESADYKANDLMDKRDLLIDRLASLIETTVEVTEDPQTGRPVTTVKIWGRNPNNKQERVGLVLVNDGVVYKAEPQFVMVDGVKHLQVKIGDSSIDITWSAEQNDPGALVGLESARQKVTGYMGSLNALAVELAEQVNAVHSEDNSIPRSDFFTFEVASSPDEPTDFEYPPDSGTYTNASKFHVNSDIINDLSRIDGGVALEVAQLRDKQTAFEDPPGSGNYTTATFEGFYTQFVTRIGTDVSGAAERVKGAQAVREQLENLRQSVIGVSIDEELTKLTQFQYAYQASARVVTVLDDLLDTIINRMAV